MAAIKEDYERVKADKELGGTGCTVLINMFKNVAVRRALVLGISLQLFQQLSGINSVMLVIRGELSRQWWSGRYLYTSF